MASAARRTTCRRFVSLPPPGVTANRNPLRSGNGISYSLDDEDEHGRRLDVADTSLESMPEQMRRAERSQFVRRALQALPPEMRQVIVMKEYEEMTFAQIAEVLGIPVSTVKSRLYTGLQQMRLRLNPLHGAI